MRSSTARRFQAAEDCGIKLSAAKPQALNAAGQSKRNGGGGSPPAILARSRMIFAFGAMRSPGFICRQAPPETAAVL